MAGIGFGLMLVGCGSADDTAVATGDPSGDPSAGGNAAGGSSAGGSLAGGAAGTPGSATGGTAGAGETGGAGQGEPVGEPIEFNPDDFNETAQNFPLNIQSGDPTSNSAIVWTRYTGSNQLIVRVYVSAEPGQATLYFEGSAVPSADGFVHVDATGLPSWTDLNYVFLEVEEGVEVSRSPIGRFKTAPAPGLKPVVRFGGTSCTKNDKRPFNTMARAGEDALDFFVQAGDTTYNDGAGSVAEFRAKWAGQWQDSGFKTLFPSTAHYSTWDDHEIENNWEGGTVDPDLRAIATQAFFENLAIRRNSEHVDRVWRKFQWGDTVEVFILDSRGERKPSTKAGPAAEYLSHEQFGWLVTGLQESTATFKIIVNSVPITRFPWGNLATDSWLDYPAQRDRLIDFIVGENIKGVLFISGDHHVGSSGTAEAKGNGSQIREVLMGPGGNDGNPAAFLLLPPQFDYNTIKSTYTVFVANPNVSPPTIHVEFKDGDGESLYTATYSF